MTTYIWWSFGLGCFGLVVKLLVIAFMDYPRRQTYERWEDVLAVVVTSGFTLWAWALLH